MTTKDKAIQLASVFGEDLAKQCVEEIINACDQVYDSDMVHFRETGDGEWWLKVIDDIDKIE